MTAKDICHQHGVAVYQVGEVYDNAPPEFLAKYFVAVTAGDFPGIEIDAIPLGDTEEHAYQIAYERLILGFTDDTEKLGVSSTKKEVKKGSEK